MSEWISVEHGEPKLSSMVLGYVDGEVVPLKCHHDGKSKYFAFVTHYQRCYPSHWMPLPEPPNEL